ncbi:hypothetical protein FACS189459_7420 [Bacilli bacterium]|nr:hypothetical protein FACS189459_7420 [Bacilli bacterium]
MPTICSAIALPVFLTQYNTNKNSLINTSANTSSITSYTIFDLPESGEMGMSTGNCGYFPFKVVDNNGDQVTSGLSIYDSTSSNIY